MEFHLFPFLTSFLLVVVMAVSHAHSLSAGESSISAHKDANSKTIEYGSYNLAYRIPQKIRGSSISTHKDVDSKTAGYGSYNLAYGIPQKIGGSSVSAHKDAYSKTTGYGSYNLAYGTPQKTGGSSISAHKDADSKTAGYGSYNLAYGTPQKTGGSSISVHKDADSKTVGYGSYNLAYGIPQKTGGSSISAHKDADSKTAGYGSYNLAYGTSQKTGGSSISAHKDADSKTAGYGSYNLAYGTPQKTGGSSVSVHKDADSKTAGYGSYNLAYGIPQNAHKDADSKTVGYGSYNLAYGTPQKTTKSSVSPSKNNPNMEQGDQDDAALNMFLEKDMLPGKKMMALFTKTSGATHFLPRQVAESIPFSSNRLPEILNWFSVEENSQEAKMIENTVKECERPVIEGEVRYCGRSWESIIDFSKSKLGKNIRLIPNIVEGEEYQEYKFEKGVEMVGEKSVVCHQLNYPYSVALCHVIQKTKIYRVPLVGADGVRVKALAACHQDTSTWAPNAPAFHVLKVKPGTFPICHFFPNGHFVWIPK